MPELLLNASSKLGPAVGSCGPPTTLFYEAEGRLADAHFGVLNTAAAHDAPELRRPPH